MDSRLRMPMTGGQFLMIALTVVIATAFVFAFLHFRRNVAWDLKRKFIELDERFKDVKKLSARQIDTVTVPACRAVCTAYVNALADYYAFALHLNHTPLLPPEQSDRVESMNVAVHKLFQRLIAMRRAESVLTDAFDVFIAHAGEDKTIDAQLIDKLNADGLRCFADVDSISAAEQTNDLGVDRGLLTSRVVLLVLSLHFVSKRWPLYEFFFASARADCEAARCKILVNLHAPNDNNSNDRWLAKVKQLKLPWPEATGKSIPPSILSTHERATKVVGALKAMLASAN